MTYGYPLSLVLDCNLSEAKLIQWDHTACDHKSYFKVIQHQEPV